MFYDLNVPWSDNSRELQRTIAFLDELGYDTVALAHTLTGRLPADLLIWPPQTPPIPSPLPFPTSRRLRILRRCNISLTDAATNHRIPQLQKHYDIVAARPTDEKTLAQACTNLDVDLISLDLTQRFEKHFKFPMLGAAITRGVKIELCYSQALLSSDPNAKRNLIGNATQLIRVSRGRGLVFSSEAKSVLGIRAPSDVINLASVWGLGHERGKDGLTKEPRAVVEFARLKRTSFKGVVDVIYGGEKAVEEKETGKKATNAQKRKAASMESTPVSLSEQEKPASKRQQKRNKKAQEESEKEKADE
ncbi:putative ribonuclease P complex subunit Pop2 [Lophiotrema nucula]|uniref:Putative ribonuclease P complex subunit Pop2 n=1 Tax=Lophiotrema nucula TaxID=690887 RepID=A0A6A5ZFU7_9PLEO|nr:putative ribonuclease P complex subunit Pop2 [Lophiotrema nucula]